MAKLLNKSKSRPVRETVAKNSVEKKESRFKGKLNKPAKSTQSFLNRSFSIYPFTDGKIGRFLTKNRRFTPEYLKGSVRELRDVKWPGFRETWKMVWMVLMFSAVLMAFVALVDFVITKIFERAFL